MRVKDNLEKQFVPNFFGRWFVHNNWHDPLSFASICDWSRKLTPLSQQSDAKLKPGFSRALGSLVIFTLNSHWLLKASSFLLIGCCDKFGFGFTTLNRKVLSWEANDDSSTSDHDFSLTMSWFPLCSCFFSGRIQWDVVHRGPETHRFDWSGYPVHNLFLICKIVHEVLFVYTWQNR